MFRIKNNNKFCSDLSFKIEFTYIEKHKLNIQIKIID